MIGLMMTDPSMYIFFSVFFFLSGLCFGSFLNVCIWRIPRGESVIFKPSHCPACGKNIRWFENIPVLSWVFLRGRCSGCGNPISIRYLIIELLTGFLFLFDYLRVEGAALPMPVIIQFISATCLFITAFVIDFRHGIIPNKITYSVISISLIVAAVFPESVGRTGHIDGFINSFFGMVAGGSVGASIAIIGRWVYKKEVFGGGDVKFIAAVGACFGFTPPAWFFVIFTGSVLGVIAGAFLLLAGKKKLTSLIVFGPFLAVAGYLWIILGPEIVTGYFSLMESLIVKIVTR